MFQRNFDFWLLLKNVKNYSNTRPDSSNLLELISGCPLWLVPQSTPTPRPCQLISLTHFTCPSLYNTRQNTGKGRGEARSWSQWENKCGKIVCLLQPSHILFFSFLSVWRQGCTWFKAVPFWDMKILCLSGCVNWTEFNVSAWRSDRFGPTGCSKCSEVPMVSKPSHRLNCWKLLS